MDYGLGRIGNYLPTEQTEQYICRHPPQVPYALLCTLRQVKWIRTRLGMYYKIYPM